MRKDAEKLLNWFADNQRQLPWRQNQDPYRVWISETMLQQTTSTAVIPFFNAFLSRFPTVQNLAKARINAVYEKWAGLGYYSRARNLHAASKLLAKQKSFPKTYQQWIELPGVGPYTARAVASIAFQQAVGVIDGNTIRVFSRLHNQGFEWWKTTDRNNLQDIADNWAKQASSGTVNQALMELGATICTPKNPKCLLCPLLSSCQAVKHQTQALLPVKRPKKPKLMIHWQLQVPTYKNKIGLQKNDYSPFLKNQLIFPGEIKNLKTARKKYDYKHMITHHEIFVSVTQQPQKTPLKTFTWIKRNKLSQITPASILQKALDLI